MEIAFGEWMPDQPDYKNPGGVTYLSNMYPNVVGGYSPVKGLTAVTDAINARARGAIEVADKSGTKYGYVGNETKIYQIGATHTDVTNSGGAYSLAATSNWEFAKWGEKVIGVAIDENPQIITLGGSNFADLGGSPPKAAHIGIIGDFVVLGNINDGTAKPNWLHWSAINDETDWTPDGDTLCDTQELRSNSRNGGGAVQAVVGGSDYGLIFQEHTIQRMTFTGSPYVFTFDEVLPNIGTPCKNSVTQEGRMVHFLGPDGFYQLVDGINLKRIGDQKVDKYFESIYDTDYPHLVIGVSDPATTLVWWLFIQSDGPNCLIYNWSIDRWGVANIGADWLYPSNNPTNSIAAYGTDFKKKLFTAEASSAAIETDWKRFNPSGRATVTRVRPLIDTDSVASMILNKVDTLYDSSISQDTATTADTTTGWMDFRSNSPYHKLYAICSADFGNFQGYDVEFTPSGRR